MNKGVTSIQKKDNQNTWGKHKIHGNDQLFMVLLQYTYVTLCTCLKYSSYFQIWITTIPLFDYLVSKCKHLHFQCYSFGNLYKQKSLKSYTSKSVLGCMILLPINTDITANQYNIDYFIPEFEEQEQPIAWYFYLCHITVSVEGHYTVPVISKWESILALCVLTNIITLFILLLYITLSGHLNLMQL